MQTIAQYQQLISDFLATKKWEKEPLDLYQPIQYILDLGGKRMRPVLTLMAAEACGGRAEDALSAALAIELFHNFSLIHDDIMDEAPLRRGKPTVHHKWNVNTGILSGDAMLILAYQMLETYPAELYKPLNQLFSKTAIEVCEGQQLDVDFERKAAVATEEYLHMIAYKTAVLLGCAMKMGAHIAKADEETAQRFYDFGRLLGIAFQIQDDYLDAFGNPETFGKQVGGDIIENKKTYLYITALQQANEEQKASLLKWYADDKHATDEKIHAVKTLFAASKADIATTDAVKNYTDKALNQLDFMQIPTQAKEELRAFALHLMGRNV